ncbi:alpha/beta fold hydrolase [Pseudoroseomonas wenyumeiae]
MLLLHSIGTTQNIWDAQAQALAGRFRVIRPDLRGHGLSSVTPGDYTMRQLARDALALLDALGIEKAHVAGTSIGGRIAQQVAVEAPERVLSLCLLNTALEFPPRHLAGADRRGAAGRHAGAGRCGDAALGGGYRPALLPRPALDAAAHRQDRLCRRRLRPAGCHRRRCRGAHPGPCTVIAGERDPAAPAEAVAALQAAIPGAELVVLPGAGHITTYEFADAVTAQMLAHFDRLGIG